MLALAIGVSLLMGLLAIWIFGRQAAVPVLAGEPLDKARAIASEGGWELSIEEQPMQDTPAGVVVSQEPGPHSRSAPGSTIHALVSSGISVPDLSGQQCVDARKALEPRGWRVRPVRWRFANEPDFGKVVAQDPAPGTVVPQAREITVQVAGPVAPC